MKKFLLTLLMTIACAGLLQAQHIFTIQGFVTDSNNMGVANVNVYIQGQQGTNYFVSVPTDASGYYSDTITTLNAQVATFNVWISNCIGDTIVQVARAISGLPTPNINFDYCNLGGGGGPGACRAHFTSFNSPAGGTQFLDNSTGTGQWTTYIWDFGDGTTAVQYNPLHVYQTSGSYYVCLTIIDSLNNCFDTFCDTISAIGSGGGGGNCRAAFQHSSQGLHTSFFNFSTGNGLSYNWNFGDGNSSTAMSPNHTYAAAGTYNVCLVISSLLCSDTVCQSITVQGGGGGMCQAGFTHRQIPGAIGVQFTNTSIPILPNSTHFLWNFGDGNTSFAVNPTHVYTNTGTYTVCLTMFDSLSNCTSTYCDSVYAQGNGGGANCNANFTSSAQGLTAFFQNSSTGNGLNYHWSFGDGNTSTAHSPIHRYATAGTYNVCLIISSFLCSDTTCTTITIQGGGGGNCLASFGYQVNGMTAQFTNRSIGSSPANPLSYSWDFGDGTPTSNAMNPSHTYANNGGYIVCLTITDMLTGCQNTFCDSLLIGGGGSGPCFANFTYNVGALGAVHFTNTSSGGGIAFNSFWSFGDGNTSTQTNPTHFYNTPGPFTVCLFISTPNCMDSVCKVVQTGGGGPRYFISGEVVKGNGNPPAVGNALVYLIEHDSTAGTLTAVDSMFTSQRGYYSFTLSAPGSFLVKAGLTPNSTDYLNYLPTYHGNSTFWNFGTYVHLNPMNPANQNVNINLIGGNNPGGPVFVGGLISQGAGFVPGPGDPVPNVSVLVFDGNDQPITHGVSDANGRYRIDQLPYGTYKIYAEIAGKTSTPHIITISPGNPFPNNLDFVVNSTWIALGLNEDLETIDFKVYPNPTQGKMNVQLELETPTEMLIQITNNLGQVVLEKTNQYEAGKQNIEIDAQDLPTGVYQLQIKSNKFIATKTIVKQY